MKLLQGGSCHGVSPSVLAAPIPPWGTPAAAGVAGSTPRHPPSNGDRLLSRNLGSYLGKREKGLVDIQSKFQYIAPKFKGFKLEVNISDSSQFNKAQLI